MLTQTSTADRTSSDTLNLSIKLAPNTSLEQNGNITDIVKVRDLSVMIKQRGSDQKFIILNEAGGLLASSSPTAAITIGVLLDKAVEMGHGSLRFSQFRDGNCVGQVLKKLGIHDPEVENAILSSPQLQKPVVDDDGDLSAARAFPATKKLNFQFKIPTGARLVYSSSTGILGIVAWNNRQEAGHLIAIPVADKDGNNLSPSKWVGNHYYLPLSANELAAKPYLGELLGIEINRQIGATPFEYSVENGLFIVTDTQRGSRFFAEPIISYAPVPNAPHQIAILRSGDLPSTYEVCLLDVTRPTSRDCEVHSIVSTGQPGRMKFDPHGNALFVHVSMPDGSQKLEALQRKDMSSIGVITNATDRFDFDDKGGVYFVDDSGNARIAITNVHRLNPDIIAATSQRRQEQLLKLSGQLATVGISGIASKLKVGKNDTANSNAAVMAKLQDNVVMQVSPRIGLATTEEELENIHEELRALHGSEEFRLFPEILQPVDKLLNDKLQALRLSTLTQSLLDLDGAACKVQDVSGLPSLYGGLQKAYELRSRVAISDLSIRQSIDEKLEACQKLVQNAIQRLTGNCEPELQKRLDELQVLFEKSRNEGELRQVFGNELMKHFDDLLTLLPSAEQSSKWRGRLNGMIEEKKAQFAASAAARQRDDFIATFRLKEEAALLFQDVVRECQAISSRATFEEWLAQSPEIDRFTRLVNRLPKEEELQELSKLEKLISEAFQQIDQKTSLQVAGMQNIVRFGDQTFERFTPTPLVYMPQIEAIGPQDGYLVYTDNRGRQFRPSLGSLPLSIKPSELEDVTKLFEADAKKFFEAKPRTVPPFQSEWVLNQWTRQQLGEIARIGEIQLAQQRSILILEGEAGTGKNVLIDMFAHFTNYEMFTFACNLRTEKEDVTYAYMFDPVKGTYRLDSRLIEVLQTPGAIALFDEVNALPIDVAKMFNSAFDGRRMIKLPDGRELPVRALVMGTMNPQYYLGVNKLSPEFKSRARILWVDYADEKLPNGKYSPYEAEILARYAPAISELKQEEFYELWNHFINNDSPTGVALTASEAQKKACANLHVIVKVANAVREKYRNYRSGLAPNEPCEFVFSMRETIECVSELSAIPRARDAIKSVVLPKIADKKEKLRVEQIIVTDN